MRPNFGRGFVAAIIATIVGAVVFLCIGWATGNIDYKNLGPWAVIFLVAMTFTFSYTFSSQSTIRIEREEPISPIQDSLDNQK